MTEKLSNDEFTPADADEIRANIARVRERIAAAARRGRRSPDEVTLVAVTKTHPAAAVNAALEAGVPIVGENRVQELLQKLPDVCSGASFHMIGHLQVNKVRQVIGHVAMIQSVDSAHLAEEIERQAAKLGIVMEVLVEVNIGGEAAKSGVAPSDTEELAEAVARLPHLRLRGLMTVPPVCASSAEVRPYFHQMRKLFVDIRAKRTDNKNISGLLRGPVGMQESAGGFTAFDTLSMGMSGDFETAVEEGATMVRVGTAIFGRRVNPVRQAAVDTAAPGGEP